MRVCVPFCEDVKIQKAGVVMEVGRGLGAGQGRHPPNSQGKDSMAE